MSKSRIAPGASVKLSNNDEGTSLYFWPARTPLSDERRRLVEGGRQVFDHEISRFDRYLVEVKRETTKGEPLKSWFYAPHASVLEGLNPEAPREARA